MLGGMDLYDARGTHVRICGYRGAFDLQRQCSDISTVSLISMYVITVFTIQSGVEFQPVLHVFQERYQNSYEMTSN